VILSNEPTYHHPLKQSAYIELRFVNEYYEFYTIGIKNYEEFKKFTENIHFKDTLTVIVKNQTIYSLIKKDNEFIKFDESHLNDKKNDLIAIIVISVIIILSLFLKL
jgi:hypothetical protein